jgi:hypothetical protein
MPPTTFLFSMDPLTTELPAFILQAAAQFASTDEYKGALVGIHLQRREDGIRVAATNGHIAFRMLVPFGQHCSMDVEELLLPASTFKKKVAHAKKAIIGDGVVSWAGGKKEAMEMLESRPAGSISQAFPQFDNLFPAVEQMKNAPGLPVGLGGEYMRLIGDTVVKYADNGSVRMLTADSPHRPLIFLTEAEGITMEILLMPVQIRS